MNTAKKEVKKLLEQLSENKPFVFRLTREKIEECRGMSPVEKLKWLEEANRFIQKVVSADQIARWKKLTRGKGP